MYCIIDLQGYSTKELAFLPKEVFLCAENASHKYFIKPPKPFESFTQSDQKVIEWNSFRYHHLPWPAGNITLGDFAIDIKERTSKYKFILCKGAEKAVYLSRILNRAVIDLTFYGCPSISKKVSASPCKLHFSNNTHCARSSAFLLDDFINGQRHLKSLFSENK
jgi:hypothetical protein